MKVQSKFGIGDFAQMKYETEDRDYFIVQKITGIVTDTCYIGTQVFYLCRGYILKKIFEKEFSKTGNFTWCVRPGVGDADNSTGLRKFREDDLIPINKKWSEIIDK